MIRLVYVAGPYRAKTPWDVEQNIRKAEELGLRIANVGALPIIPHSMYRFFDKQCDETFWLRGTETLLTRCNAIYLLKEWEESEGSNNEFHLATEMKLPIFIEDCERDWTKFIEWAQGV